MIGKPFVLRIDQETRDALDRLARETERSGAAVVRFLVKREAGLVPTARGTQIGNLQSLEGVSRADNGEG